METKRTGGLADGLGKPIAAGNLFLGKFDGSKALTDAMKATQFGVPFDKKPKKLTGWYKYSPSSQMVGPDGNGGMMNINNISDSCQIYAVFYLTDANTEWLYGDDALTSPALVAKAVLENGSATFGNDFHYFELDFDYGGKTIDEQKLRNFEYKIAIVFSASKRGGEFIGALGSKLIVDDIRIEIE